ncbi:MAG TPA: hypothetical protein VF121_04220, partial [Thermoanaerobaculia bacterium]|nr:hypothetical protein [Thermoanaerobaculia bacterium]
MSQGEVGVEQQGGEEEQAPREAHSRGARASARAGGVDGTAHRSARIVRHRALAAAAPLALLLLWAPLPFGSVTPAALAALEVAAFLALALAAAAAPDLRPLRPAAPVLAALLALALWGLLQSAPWPAAAAAA